MGIISRGFQGRRTGWRPAAARPVPDHDFPVLSAGPTPRVPLDRWEFAIATETGQTHRWTWPELMALPAETPTVDIHCVTKWSKLGTSWRGVSLDTLLEDVETDAPTTRWSTPTAATPPTCRWRTCSTARRGSRYRYDGEELAPEHGGPARLLVPHLYFWKSAKWVRGIRLTERGRAGLLGDRRLPQLRRPMARAAVPGRLSAPPDLAGGRRSSRCAPETATAPHAGARRARLAGAPGRPARRRPADRRGRLQRPAQLLDPRPRRRRARSS